ncbi:hypothetical protein LG293_16595 (plasmid) [Citricoccus nitrophenolicus]
MRRKIATHRPDPILERAHDERNRAEEKIGRAHALIRHELAHHQPRSFSLDLSSSTTEELRAELAERISEGRGVFCTICRTPWPCQSIAVFRQLRDVLYGVSEDTIPPRGKAGENPALVL